VRSRGVLPLLLTIPLITCCATTRYEDLRHERDDLKAELEKAQMFIAGAQDDNAMLQREIIRREEFIMQQQGGLMLKALENAKLRNKCDI
jgi:hypothetical protein